MASNNSRTSTLKLEAQNNVSRPFAEVAASVDSLAAKIAAQAQGAAKAEITTRELTTTVNKLGDAQKALVSQDALSRNYQALSKSLSEAAEKAAAASVKLEDLRAKQGTAEGSTSKFARALRSAESGAANAQKSFDRLQTRVGELGARLEAVGANVHDLESFQLGLAETNEKVSASIAVARDALENYDANLRAHRAALKEAADAAKAAEAFDRAYAEAVEEDAARLEAAYKEAIAINKERDAEAKKALEAQIAAREAEAKAIQKADAIRAEAEAENQARDEAAGAKAAQLVARAIKAEEDKARTIRQFNIGLSEQLAAEAQKRYDAEYKEAVEINTKKDALAREQLAREQSIMNALAREVRRMDAIRAEAEAENERRDRAATIEAQKQADARKKIARDLLAEQVRANSRSKPSSLTKESGEEGGEEGSSGQQPGALGLRPYELQELGYRIKDIIDQLGAGSSITRVIAQQGAATASIFVREAGQLVAYLPVIAAGAAAVGLLAAAFYRLNESAASLRAFNAELKLSVDGSKYSAETLVAEQRAIQDMGNSFKESGEAIREFMSKSIDPEQFNRFAKAATMVSRIYGTAFPESVKETTAAFTGNYEAIAKLDDKYDFLSRSQRAQIRDMFEQGHAAEASAQAFELYSDKLDKSAKVADGPWSAGFRTAKLALDAFLDGFSHDTGLDRFISKIDGVTEKLESWERYFQNIRREQSELPDPETGLRPDETRDRIADLKGRRDALTQRLGEMQSNGAQGFGLSETKDALREVSAQLAILESAYMRVQRAATSGTEAQVKAAKGLGKATEDQKKQIDDYLHQLELEDQARVRNNTQARLDLAYREAVAAAQAKLGTGTAEQDKAAQQAGNMARLAEQDRINIELRRKKEGLQRELAGLVAEGDKSMTDSLQARLEAITERYSATYEKIKDFQARGGRNVPDGKGGTMSLDTFKAEQQAQEELLKQQETMKFYEEELTKLTSERDAKLKQINDDVKAGNITGLQGYDEAKKAVAGIAPQIKRIADDALRFAHNLGSAHTGPGLDSFVDKFNRATGNDATKGTEAGGPVAKTGQELANSEIEKANDIMRTRNDLQEAYGELVTKGIISEQEAESRLKADYAQTDAELQKAVKNAQDLVKALQAAGNSPELDLLAAKLQKISDSTQYVSKSAEEMNKEFLKVGEESVNKGLEGITDQLGKVLAGTEKWGQALHGIVQAVGSMVSSFLTGIAQILLKQEEEQVELMLLKALGLGTGGSSGSNGGLGGLSSIFGGGTADDSAFAGAGEASSGAAGAADALDSAAAVAHGGGRVGPVMDTTRFAPSHLFANAPRYHAGAMIGLAPNEQAAILQHGEEVLTRSDPRNALNGGKGNSIGGQPQINMRHILVMDPDMIPQAMLSARGEETTMSHIKNNLPTLRQLLNVGGRRVGGS